VQLRGSSRVVMALALAMVSAGALLIAGLVRTARADDRIDVTTTWFQEQRRGGLGGLTVIHPQADVGVDMGDSASLELGYSADVVSGATAAVYSVDAVSTATLFEDVRHEGRVSLGFRGQRSALTLNAATGMERDYNSIAVGAQGSVDLPGKNTNLALSYTRNLDEVCDKKNDLVTPLERRALTGADDCLKKYQVFGQDTGLEDLDGTVWRDLTIDTLQATLTQNLSPVAAMQLSLFGQVLDGFQANPYRRVRIGNNEPQESVPEVRARAALMARLNFYVPAVRGAVHLSARGYSDTWGVNSATGEMAYSQYAGDSLLLRLRARFYQQTAATFFKDAFYYQTESTAGAYFTGDRELAPVRNVLLGAKLSFIKVDRRGKEVWGIFDRIQLNLKGDVLLLDELPAGDIEGNLAGIGNQFLSAGQLIDAIVLQLGLLMSY
jgi:hypothetical protein